MVVAHCLPARVGENVSDEWVWTCQGTLRGIIPLHLSRWKQGFVRAFWERFLIFIDIPQKSHRKISNYYIPFTLFLFPPDVPFYAALFQCRSCPGISTERCLTLILAKSYPIFWQVCTCQVARFHIANIHSLSSEQNKSTVRCQPHRQNFFCLKVSLLRC